jgi:multiple sugar transport system permease protein
LEPVPPGPALRARATRRATDTLGAWRSDGAARWLFIWPTVLLVLILSIFPLVASVALSLSRLAFHQGGVDLKFIGFANYQQLLFGLERSHFLGVLKSPTPLGWALVIGTAVLVGIAWTRAVRGGQVGPFGLVLRLIAGVMLVGFVWLLAQALFSDGGRPGALIVTLIFVFVGIALQYGLGLGLALLAVQQVPWRRFFRIVFLIPLTITPVGIGYMFLMMTDTSKGPLEPIWVSLGLRDFTWVTDPWLARLAVIIGDTWQWTPFVFIVLLAALESLDQEVNEAALVDGAGRWQSFHHIIMPALLPVTTTIILIRLIEGFKIIDMPNILLGGGPGTATQSMTLQAWIDWNTLNLGRSAAVAYLLLILVTVVATVYVSFVRRRVTALA